MLSEKFKIRFKKIKFTMLRKVVLTIPIEIASVFIDLYRVTRKISPTKQCFFL